VHDDQKPIGMCTTEELVAEILHRASAIIIRVDGSTVRTTGDWKEPEDLYALQDQLMEFLLDLHRGEYGGSDEEE